jgi:hypothetical protein
MTPEDYRARWGLPGNYPMVAPSYAVNKSDQAKRIGLGRGSGPGKGGAGVAHRAAPTRTARAVQEPATPAKRGGKRRGS